MHLGLIIYGSLDIVSGGFLYDRKLVAHLMAQGHTVEVIGLPWAQYMASLKQNFAPELRQKLCAPYDLLLQDELNHPSLVWLNQQIRPQINYPIISIVHHLRCLEPRARWQNWLYRQIERQYLQTVDGFIFNSQTTKQTVADLIGELPPHVVAYPAGDRFAGQKPRPWPIPSPPSTTPLRLLFVGSVTPRKGLHTLFKALEHLPASAWHLDVVGGLNVDLSYALAMQQYVSLNEWQKQVKFWDVLDEEALAARDRAADILVVPSLFEGFGIVYLEAMSFGIGAIGTTGGAAGEIITHGRDGFLITPNDHQHLADILPNLHHNRPLLAELGHNARARYEAHPTWEQMGETVNEFLRSMVG
jgi:glycosyltransferase involved in cell wall biosynthesis